MGSVLAIYNLLESQTMKRTALKKDRIMKITFTVGDEKQNVLAGWVQHWQQRKTVTVWTQ